MKFEFSKYSFSNLESLHMKFDGFILLFQFQDLYIIIPAKHVILEWTLNTFVLTFIIVILF